MMVYRKLEKKERKTKKTNAKLLSRGEINTKNIQTQLIMYKDDSEMSEIARKRILSSILLKPIYGSLSGVMKKEGSN